MAEVADVRATSAQLARRLAAANRWAAKLGVSPKAVRIPGLPDHSTAELLKKQIGTFEEFLRLREAGDIARQRKLRGR